MKSFPILLTLVSATLLLSCKRDPIPPKPIEINYHYATFTIDGEKQDCALLTLYTATWEEAYAEDGEEANFFDFSQTVLVPIGAPDTWYPFEDASDFWDIVGKNTDYVDAPEECMADNFAFAVVDGLNGRHYESPWLIEKIIALLP